MNDIRKKIEAYIQSRVPVFGFAPVDRFSDAPELHHPSKICRDGRTVIVIGKPISRGALRAPDYTHHVWSRSYHTVYDDLNTIAFDLCNFIESLCPAYAVAVPSFAPLAMHQAEPWGLLSLKHAAVRAGLGRFGKNQLVHHPQYGTLLRLVAVITSAELPGDGVLDGDPCKPGCSACLKACRAKAFTDEGTFNKMGCLGSTIKHAMYSVADYGKDGLELVINTAGYNYWIDCHACLAVCPNNRS